MLPFRPLTACAPHQPCEAFRWAPGWYLHVPISDRLDVTLRWQRKWKLFYLFLRWALACSNVPVDVFESAICERCTGVDVLAWDSTTVFLLFCFNDCCLTFTRFTSLLGISFQIPSEIWIIHKSWSTFPWSFTHFCLKLPSQLAVLEGSWKLESNPSTNLSKRIEEKNSPFKSLSLLKHVYWIFYEVVENLWWFLVLLQSKLQWLVHSLVWGSEIRYRKFLTFTNSRVMFM